MTAINIHGALGEQFGKIFHLNVNSPAEAVRALIYMVPNFKDAMMNYDYRIVVGNLDNGDELAEDQLTIHTCRDIHLIPVIQGAKKGVGKIIAAIVVIAAAIAYTAVTGDIVGGSQIASIGISMGLRGISMLLAPQIEETDNKLFNNSVATGQQGSPIPLLYGEMYIELTPVSASITAGLAPTYTNLDYTESGTGVNGTWNLYRNVTDIN